jgi:hypothetical protein
MGAKEWRTELRGAVYRADGTAVVALAREAGLPEDALQLLGDGLVVAVGQSVEGTADLAAGCVKALRERGWYGDDELADHLEAALGVAAMPMLRPLGVDLAELAGILEGDELGGGGRIDRQTGEVWHRAAVEYAQETGEEDPDESDDPERWIWVDCEGSRDGYRDMEMFIGTVADPDRADRLEIAIQGRGAFRRFKDVLARWPGELERWFAFSEDRQRGRARAWLAAAGYRPSPLPPSPFGSSPSINCQG